MAPTGLQLRRRLRRLAAAPLQRLPRLVAAHRPGIPPVVEEEVLLVSAAGYQIYAHVHRRPDLDRPRPGVLLCPGIDDPGTSFDGLGVPASADELARAGAVVLHFDPAGRGRSWGDEDLGGLEHQDDVAVALRYLLGRPDVVPARSGVLAVSLGIGMAVGALAAHGDTLPVGWLVDWEGPSDREIITAGGRILFPAGGHAMDDEAWWGPREAVRHVGRLRCGYFRYQAGRDHAQPGEHRHAMRMLNAARDGGVPWFQLNDHPRDTVPEEPRWYPPGMLAANHILIRKIREFSGL